MKRWIPILVMLAAAWMVVFAVLRSRQSPPDLEHEWNQPPQALSKASRKILDASQEVVLLSIDPNRPEGANVSETKEKFHEYPILGQVQIKDPKKRSELLSALYKAVRKSRGEGVPGCFEPRHGIRAVVGTNWIELVICFECVQVAEYGPEAAHGRS